MFGYVRPCTAQLRVWESDYFKAVYCGLCRTLSKRYGYLSRNLLQYDFVFLALLLDEHTSCLKVKRCPVHPIKGCRVSHGSAALDASADATVLMAYYKLGDAVRDGGFIKSVPLRLILLWIRPKYKKAAARLPETDRAAQSELEELLRLEQTREASIDAPADTFARILSAMAETAGGQDRRQLKSLLYHLGRWIYIIDAADDLQKDFKRGGYNPIAERFHLTEGEIGPEVKAEIQTTLAFSRLSALLALGLLEANKNRDILENTLTLGLAAVEERVLNGEPPRRLRTAPLQGGELS